MTTADPLLKNYCIRLRFVADRALSSKIIDWFTTGQWSHVGVITDDGLQEFGARIRKSGAKRAGVQYRPLNYAEFTRQEILTLPCTLEQYAEFWKAAKNVHGYPYSLRVIFGFVINHSLHHELHGFDCSSLIMWLLYCAGMLPHELRSRERLIAPQACYYYVLGLMKGLQLTPKG